MPDLWQLLLEGEPAAAASERASLSGDGAPQPQRTSSAGLQLPRVASLQRSSSVASSGGSGGGGSGPGTPRAAAPPTRLGLAWGPALGLLQQYIGYPAESTAVLGVNQLHSLLLAAAPALDAASWQAAFLALQAVCLRDPWQPDDGATAALPGSPAGASDGLLAAAAAAEALRRRSRVAVLLQRVLDSVLAQRAAAMPGQVQLQLLELLHRTVVAAAELNADAGCRAAAERTLAARAAAAAAAAAGRSGGSLAGSEPWAADVPSEAVAAALGADAAPSVGPAVALEVGDDSPAPPAAASWEQLRPALARQEAEGGCLYISALQRCIASPASSNGTQAAAAAECEARLATFCLWVVQAAADRAASAASAAAGTGSAAAEAFASSPGPSTPGSAAAGGANGGAAAAVNPADQAWDDAVR